MKKFIASSRFSLLPIAIAATLRVIRPSLLSVVVVLACLSSSNYLLAATPDEETEKQLLETHISGLERIITKDANVKDAVKIQIARNLRLVSLGLMPAEMFYRSMAGLEMPKGKEARHMLNEVKKDIANYMGAERMGFFFGESFPEGGSKVESVLLAWRRAVVRQAVQEVLTQFRGKNVINNYKFRVFKADIGSWVTENLRQMTFAGDIDFSFLTGDLKLAKAMKDAFDTIISARVGLTAEQFDTVCTAHGMATPEVYLAKHGQGSAEDAIKKGTVTEILLDEGRLGAPVEGQQALEDIV